MEQLKKKALFNEHGDIEVTKRRMINGNTTNLNDFNNMKYPWVSDWYRQAMNNFWVPEEINLNQDVKDYRRLSKAEKTAYDKILSFLVFLDSLQTANLPNVSAYITANEVNLCLTIQAFQEALHSQSYSYMLDTICEPQERNDILYQWKNDPLLLERNRFIGDQYNAFQENRDAFHLVRMMRSATSTAMKTPTCGSFTTSSESCRKRNRSSFPLRIRRSIRTCCAPAWRRNAAGPVMSSAVTSRDSTSTW